MLLLFFVRLFCFFLFLFLFLFLALFLFPEAGGYPRGSNTPDEPKGTVADNVLPEKLASEHSEWDVLKEIGETREEFRVNGAT